MIRGFSTSITSDPVFCALSPMAQLLYFKLYMHPGNHLCGLFMYSAAHMAVDLQANPQDAGAALDALVKAGFVEVDRACNLVWIPEMAARIGDITGERNKIAPAVRKYLKGVCPRKSALIDRVSDTLFNTISDRVAGTVSDALADRGCDRPLSGSVSGTVSEESPLTPQTGESARLFESPTSEQTAGWVKVIAAQGKQEQPSEPTPPQGLPGIPDKPSDPEKAPKSNRKRDRDKGAWAEKTLMATTLLAELSQARMRVRSGLRPIKPLPSTLEHITARLVEGYTAEDIRHVIRVCEEESKHSAQSFAYFDAVTPFLPANFARKVARAIEDAGRQSRPAQVFRPGPPTPEETARINETRRLADEARTADALEAARKRREIVVDAELEQSRANFLKIAFAATGGDDIREGERT